MAGGTFDSYNKPLPGYYLDSKVSDLAASGLDTAGPVALALELNWGGEEINEITPETDLLAVLGAEVSEIIPIREAFKANPRLLVYNLCKKGDKAKAEYSSEDGELKVEARKDGEFGNKINVVLEPTPLDTVAIRTYVASQLVDSVEYSVTGASSEEISYKNNYVTVTGIVPDAEATLDLSGGKSGEVTAGSYSKWLEVLGGHHFKAFVPGREVDADIHTLLSAQARLWADDYGKRATAVLEGYHTADDEFTVAAPEEDITLSNGEIVRSKDAKYFYAAAYAAAGVQSLTYRTYPGAVDVTRRDKKEQIDRTRRGQSCFVFVQGAEGSRKVVILKDITSFTSFTKDKNEDYSKGKIMRTLNVWHDNVKHVWNEFFIGKWSNSASNRSGLVGKILEVVADPLVRAEAIDQVYASDLQVAQGPKKEDVILNSAILVHDAMEKLYEHQKLQ